MVSNKVETIHVDLPEAIHYSTGITISTNEILIYGGIRTMEGGPSMNAYILNTKTNKIRKSGEVPG